MQTYGVLTNVDDRIETFFLLAKKPVRCYGLFLIVLYTTLYESGLMIETYNFLLENMNTIPKHYLINYNCKACLIANNWMKLRYCSFLR
jgi:hypothetical protein